MLNFDCITCFSFSNFHCNPKKIEGLERHGVMVVDRIPLVIKPNPHNRDYMRTKLTKSGHLLDEAFK